MNRSDQAIEERFIELMVPAARHAARIASALEGQVANRPKAGEATPVKAALTIADSAAQEAILVPLADGLPNVMLRAEEDTPSVRRFPTESPHLVVVDPIDGTLHAYLERAGPYSVMIGLARGDRYRASVIALPRENILVYGVSGSEARVEPLSEDGAPVPSEVDGRDVLVSQGVSEDVRGRIREAGFRPRFGSGGAIALAPLLPGVSAGLRVSEGPEGVSIRGRIGVLLSRCREGVAVASRDGDFPDDLSTPCHTLLVARRTEEIEMLRAALRTR